MARLIRILILMVLVIAPGLSGGLAQTTPPSFDDWRRVATRAEESIQSARASEAAMGALRDQLVDWREEFTDFASTTGIAIKTLEARLESLGPSPEKPGDEPSEIATHRKDLNAQLAKARVPIVKAELASTEAEKLIEGVDKLLRDRHASELQQRGPSPVFLKNWKLAIRSLKTSGAGLFGEVQTAWAYEKRSKQFSQNAVRFFLLLAVAIVLLTRGAIWTTRALGALKHPQMSASRQIAGLFISLGYVIVPLVGIYILVEALYTIDLVGLRGERVLKKLPLAAFLYLMPVWIGRRIFTPDGTNSNNIRLSDRHRRQALQATYLLGAVMALHQIFKAVAGFDGWGSEARSVILFPLIFSAALLMLRFAHLFRANVIFNKGVSDSEVKYYDHFLTVLARFYQAAAVIGTGLAVAGYTRASEALIFPAIYSVQLVTFLVLLHRLFNKVFSVRDDGGAESERTLWPLILSSAAVLASTPVFLLIWGMRPLEISTLYAQILSGVRVGEITISPSQIIIFVAVFSIGYALTRLIQSFLKNTFLPRTRLDVGGQNAVVAGVGYVGITLAAMIALNNTGIDLGSIALVASALSVGIGFGLQTIVSNFVSGIILLIERPIAEGDWIEVNGQMGYVRDISVRSTRIETFDRTDVIVPNSDLVAGTVTNYTRGNTVGRVIVPVGVAYGTDPRLIERILLEVANAHPMILAAPAPYVVFQGFGDSSLDFEVRAILRDVNWVLSVRSDMNYEIARRFVEEGIEIPFPQQDVWFRNPDAVKHGVQVEPVSPQELKSVSQPDNDGPDGPGDTQ